MSAPGLPATAQPAPLADATEAPRVPNTSMLPEAEAASRLKTGQLRQAYSPWVERVRCAVRDKPVLLTALALALGAVAVALATRAGHRSSA